MAYRIEFRPAAFRELTKVEKSVQRRIAAKVDSLAQTPCPSGVEKLKGHQNRYRVRCGEYRIIYEIHDEILLVLVLRLGHRGRAYR